MTPEREQQLLDEIAALKRENELLRQKLDLVLRKLFGKSSEALDPAQLELLLRHGEVEIDNNPIENAIRPTAIGKKNWSCVSRKEVNDVKRAA